MQRRIGDRLKPHSLLYTAPLTALLLLTTVLPGLPVAARQRNEFQTCAADLSKAGIAPEQIASACAEALSPTELSRCTVGIKQATPITPSDIVSACYRVRRPLDLAACVIDISRRIPDTVPIDVLNNCRRSLLPVRFSDCVVALHREIDLSAPTAMQTCIDARDLSVDGNSSPTLLQPQ